MNMCMHFRWSTLTHTLTQIQLGVFAHTYIHTYVYIQVFANESNSLGMNRVQWLCGKVNV